MTRFSDGHLGQQPDDASHVVDFQRTDFDSARAALEDLPAGVKPAAPVDPSHWTSMRRPGQPGEGELEAATLRWIESLPDRIRPLDLAHAFPRIANELCSTWDDATKSADFLANLIIDWRGDRHGFPKSVVSEMLVLRDYRLALQRRDAALAERAR